MRYTEYLTLGNGRRRKEEGSFVPEAGQKRLQETKCLVIQPTLRYQSIEGFGAALTESSAWLLSRMKEEERAKLIRMFFGAKNSRYRFVRVPIDSCDFSLSEYQAVEDPTEDPDLDSFSLKRDEETIIPMMKEILAANPEVSVLLSPWSPPKQWKEAPKLSRGEGVLYGFIGAELPKDGGPTRILGGKLKKEHYKDWARYLCRYVEEYLEQGIPVTMLTMQNEEVAVTPWPSCVWEPEEIKEFSHLLYAQMQEAGLTERVGLYYWDHNKERVVERSLAMFDPETRGMFEGIAFHWYSGDHFEAVRQLRELYPEKKLMLSECCESPAPGRSRLDPVSFFYPFNFYDRRTAIHYAREIIGDFAAGANRFLDWNLVLDRKGGPRTVKGGCTAPAVVDKKGNFKLSAIYSYVRHFSGYIDPGATVLGLSRYGDELEALCCENPDGKKVLVVLNARTYGIRFHLRMVGEIAHLKLPARSIATFVIGED